MGSSTNLECANETPDTEFVFLELVLNVGSGWDISCLVLISQMSFLPPQFVLNWISLQFHVLWGLFCLLTDF